MWTLLVLVTLVSFAGCGVITHGTLQKVSCTTIPEGALVRSAEGGECRTPCTVKLNRKMDETLTIERDGYERITLSLRSVMLKTSVANVLLPGGLVCWGIDLASGGAYRLVPERVDVKLTPIAPEGP